MRVFMKKNINRFFIIGLSLILFAPLFSSILTRIFCTMFPHLFYGEYYELYTVEMYVSIFILGIILCIHSKNKLQPPD